MIVGRCIYCGEPAESEEHWLPRGLGAIRGLLKLKDRLCVPCNNALGALDRELVRTGPTGFLRAAHGIRGRADHPEVSPFLYKGSSAQPPTIIEMPAPDGEGTILAAVDKDEDGNRRATPLRQLVLKAPDGRVAHIPFSPQWNSDVLNRALQERKLEHAELIGVYLGEDGDPESLKLRQLLSSVFPKFHAKANFGVDDNPQIKRVIGRFGISREYLRAIAKVGFHYFIFASPVFRGDEPEFAGIRAFIRKGEGEWETFVVPTTEQFIPQLRQGHRPPNPSHFFYAEVNMQTALARVQFFVSEEDLPLPSLVRLGRSPSRLSGRWMSAHWLSCFKEKTEGHDGEIAEVDVGIRRIVVP